MRVESSVKSKQWTGNLLPIVKNVNKILKRKTFLLIFYGKAYLCSWTSNILWRGELSEHKENCAFIIYSFKEIQCHKRNETQWDRWVLNNRS